MTMASCCNHCKGVVKHSRLESYLKRHFHSTSNISLKRLNTSNERIIHYESCVICGPCKDTGPMPFNACLILTNYQVLLTDIPHPRNLRPLLKLKYIQDITPVAEPPPEFLLEEYRDDVQRLRISYIVSDNDKDRLEGNSTCTQSSMLSDDASGSSTTKNFASVTTEVCSSGEPKTLDVILLSSSSKLGHILYTTWVRYLTADVKCFIGTTAKSDLKLDDNSTSKFQWLLKIISLDDGINYDLDAKIYNRFIKWSTECHHFSQLVWKDATVFKWLLRKLYQFELSCGNNEDSKTILQNQHYLMLHTMKSLKIFLHFADIVAVWQIIDPLFLYMTSCLVHVLTCNNISNEIIDESSAVISTLILLPCPCFSSKVIKYFVLNEWINVVETISRRCIYLIKRSFLSTECCLALFHHLFLLMRFLQFNTNSENMEIFLMKYGGEFRYFASEARLKSRNYKSPLRNHIILLFTKVKKMLA